MVGKEGDVIATATIATYDHIDLVGMRTSERVTANKEGYKIMRNITRPEDRNRYYMYRDHVITRTLPQGYYSTYTRDGRLMADTQRGIKKLINDYIGGQKNE